MIEIGSLLQDLPVCVVLKTFQHDDLMEYTINSWTMRSYSRSMQISFGIKVILQLYVRRH